MTDLPKNNRCGKCGEWFHNAHACGVNVTRTMNDIFRIEFDKLGYHWSESNIEKARLGWELALAYKKPKLTVCERCLKINEGGCKCSNG